MEKITIPQKALNAGKSAYLKLITDMHAMENGLALGLSEYADEPEVAAALPLWMRTASTKAAVSQTSSGAAILPKSATGDSDIPRLPTYIKMLHAIARTVKCREKAFVRSLLRDVCFQHHQSTNGRWNSALQRFERYGVRSVDQWRKACVNSTPFPASDASIISKRTFHRIKDQLIDLGLIRAEQHIWHNAQALWIKPTEKLCRIIFEAGYWQTISAPEKPKAVQPAPASPATKKPRGLSARHAAITAELSTIYKSVIAWECDTLPKAKRWAIFEQLTKPISLSEKVEKPPFAFKGSHRYKRVYECLNLHAD